MHCRSTVLILDSVLWGRERTAYVRVNLMHFLMFFCILGVFLGEFGILGWNPPVTPLNKNHNSVVVWKLETFIVFFCPWRSSVCSRNSNQSFFLKLGATFTETLTDKKLNCSEVALSMTGFVRIKLQTAHQATKSDARFVRFTEASLHVEDAAHNKRCEYLYSADFHYASDRRQISLRGHLAPGARLSWNDWRHQPRTSKIVSRTNKYFSYCINTHTRYNYLVLTTTTTNQSS